MVKIEKYIEKAKRTYLVGQLEQARKNYLAVLQLDPYYTDALHGLGQIASQNGDNKLSVFYLERAAAIDKNRPDVLADLGVAYRLVGNLMRAELNLKKAIILQPENPHFHYNLGLVLGDQTRFDEAAEVYQHTINLSPNHTLALNNLANILKRQNKLDDAISFYERSISADQNYAPAHKNLADVYETSGDVDSARYHFSSAIRIGHDVGAKIREAMLLPVIPDSLDQILEYRHKTSERLDQLFDQNIIIEDPLRQIGATNFLMAYHGMDDCLIQSKLANLYVKSCSALSFEAPHCAKWTPERAGEKYKIGFVSKFFFNHTIQRLNKGLIFGLPRDRFEIIIYSLSDISTGGREEGIAIEGDKFVKLSSDLGTARRQIAGDRLDILYYTDIGMEPQTYFLAFSRLAPIQCVAWGHPVTTGIPNLDYFISSCLIEPENANRAYREQLVQLSGLPICISDPSDGMVLSPTSQEDKGRRIFCPQSLFKFHPGFDKILGVILGQCPKANLILLEGNHPTWTKKLRERLTRSIPQVADRIYFASRTDRRGFMNLLASVDVILDPTHFSGGITTFEALSVGTPVVTLPSTFMRGRVSLGLYTKMRVTDCVASDELEYVEHSVRLVNDRRWNTEMRQKILEAKSAIFESTDAVNQHIRFFDNASTDIE